MKSKIILLALGVYSCSCAIAQTDNETQKETKWQVGLSLNSVEPIQELGTNYWVTGAGGSETSHRKDKTFNVGLFINYKIKKNCALRLYLKITNYNKEVHYDSREILPFTSSVYQISDGKAESSIINISPGILRSLNYNIINVYGGFELIYKKYTDLVLHSNFSEYKTQTDSLIEMGNQEVHEEEGFSFGLGSFIGFTISVTKSISIGSEFSSSFMYYKLGGNIDIVRNDLLTNSTNTQQWQETGEGFRFGIAGSINISIKF